MSDRHNRYGVASWPRPINMQIRINRHGCHDPGFHRPLPNRNFRNHPPPPAKSTHLTKACKQSDGHDGCHLREPNRQRVLPITLGRHVSAIPARSPPRTTSTSPNTPGARACCAPSGSGSPVAGTCCSRGRLAWYVALQLQVQLLQKRPISDEPIQLCPPLSCK